MKKYLFKVIHFIFHLQQLFIIYRSTVERIHVFKQQSGSLKL